MSTLLIAQQEHPHLTEENIKDYLTHFGYTRAAENHPEFPQFIVLSHLEASELPEEFKAYFRGFIQDHFTD